MIPAQMGVLDIKTTQMKKNVSSKKGDKGFENEIAANEKKLKKKSAQEESLAASHANKKIDRPVDKKSPETQSAGRNVSVKNNSNAKATGLNGENKTEVAGTQTDVSKISSNAFLDQNPELMLDPALSTNPLSGITEKTLASHSQNGLSLEGLQLVQLQLMMEQGPLNINEESTESSLQEALQNLVETSGGKEKSLKDLLAKNSEQEAQNFDFQSDLLNPQLQNKETQNQNQIFSAVLENKQDSVDSLKQENLDNIIKQASTIIKDGGGEMKMQLTPEGLGTVDLKVGVNNGEVSIEIMAQDKEVKKMFEESVFEIRGALENQNLKVETFKVGVSEHFDKSMSQGQFQMMDRDFARNFMGQFRDERQSLRNQGIDSFINNKSPFDSKPEGLQPLQNRLNSNGRLNIIA